MDARSVSAESGFKSCEKMQRRVEKIYNKFSREKRVGGGGRNDCKNKTRELGIVNVLESVVQSHVKILFFASIVYVPPSPPPKSYLVSEVQ